MSIKQKRRWRAGKSISRLQQWGDFRREAAALLRLLGEVEGRFIIFVQSNRNRFVQFRVFEDGTIRGEAVSNKWLRKGDRLTPATHQELVEHGWHNPGKTSPNFWSAWQPPVPIANMASLAVATLHYAFEIASPYGLEIRCERAELKPNRAASVGLLWRKDAPRRRGIKIELIDHFNARGMRRVYGRGDAWPVAVNRSYKRNMDVWLTSENRLLARFWARASGRHAVLREGVDSMAGPLSKEVAEEAGLHKRPASRKGKFTPLRREDGGSGSVVISLRTSPVPPAVEP